SKTWYKSPTMSGKVSDGTTTAVLPAASTGNTRDRNPKSGASFGQITPTVPIGSSIAMNEPIGTVGVICGASFGQITPTVPIGSFIAMAIVRNGGLCTVPSNLSV